MSLTFHWLSSTTLPVHGAILKPQAFEGKSALEAARMRVGLGNSSCELGDLFKIEGTSGDATLRLEGDLSHVDGIGQAMSRGRIEVRGSVGSLLGAQLAGGSIEVNGSAGDWLGSEMVGGSIRIRGDAGDYVGAAMPGSAAGMRGGSILIDGSAGDEVGLSMRRGLIAILGNSGDGMGRAMIAGTIILGGRSGTGLGTGMKRGTLAMLGQDPSFDMETVVPVTFVRAGSFVPTFLTIYLRRLASWGWGVPDPHSVSSVPYERYNGDTVNGGQGEILFRR